MNWVIKFLRDQDSDIILDFLTSPTSLICALRAGDAKICNFVLLL